MHALLLDFLKVTESAAIAAMPWVGSGNKNAADGAATSAMRIELNKMDMSGTVVIGEGEIDEAPMLYIGEKLGTRKGLEIDIAVDPIEGTTPTVNGQGDAITVIAAGPKGTLLHAPDMYMEKIAVGPRGKGKIDIQAPLLDNMKNIAKANGKEVSELNILIQDRSRHQEYIDIVRQASAKVFLFDNNDVVAAVSTCVESANIDMMVGIGGAPEGVLGAVALKCLGGEMQAKLLPQNEEEYNRCLEMNLFDPRGPLRHSQLVNSEDCIFAATGITDNLLLNGVKREKGCYRTHSMLISGKDKQLHFIESVFQKNEGLLSK